MSAARRLALPMLAAGLILGATAGCGRSGADTPALPVATPVSELGAPAGTDGAGSPTVALALGGGGLRGLAHIGVLRALEEAGIEPDLVVGTSAGALVGAAYASGKRSEEIAAIARDVDIPSFVDWTISSGGIMRGKNIAGWVDALTAGVPIESFPTRFAAVATDLQSGAAVVVDRGSAGQAVRASAAVPGVNVAVPYRGGHLVDGGVSSLVPVRAARALGGDIVIAVDIYCHRSGASGLTAASVLRQVMHTQSCLIAAPELAEADILITPVVAVPGISDKEQQQRAIQAGYESARRALSKSGLAFAHGREDD